MSQTEITTSAEHTSPTIPSSQKLLEDDQNLSETSRKRHKPNNNRFFHSIMPSSAVHTVQLLDCTIKPQNDISYSDYPIHFFLWHDDGSIEPLNFQSPPITKSSHLEPFYPTKLPKVSTDAILATHKECLPLDTLPATFITEITADCKGTLILALQFIPNAPQQSDPTRNVPYTTHVMGCIAGLFMQFWSRMAETEFKLKRILNIFSVFVSPQVRRRGVGSGLFDSIVKLYTTRNIAENDSRFPKIEEISLEVRATNKSAQALYKSKGFTVQNEEKNYYEFGVNQRDKTMFEMVVEFDQFQFTHPKLR